MRDVACPAAHKLVGWMLDLLVPPRCVGCARRETWLCPDCRAALPRLPAARCAICAVPMVGPRLCPSCYRNPPPFRQILAPLLHDDLARQMVLDLKFRRRRHLAEPLARLAAAEIDDASIPAIDVIVPVPLHGGRLAERGFNQSELLARHLGTCLDRPVDGGVLSRVRRTVPQTGLAARDRISNVHGAFVARPAGGRILLVDDVCTTGATIAACATALRKAGADEVVALVVTRAAAGI